MTRLSYLLRIMSDSSPYFLTAFRSRLYQFVSQRVVYHTLFWLVLLFILLGIGQTDRGLWFTLGNDLIFLGFYGVVVYFNLLYLIPNYLTQKKFFSYIVLLMLASLVITPLMLMVLYVKLTHYPEAQRELLYFRNYYFLLTFMVGSASTLIKIIMDWVRHQRERQELETRTMQSELRFLKSQINPHFLFNTLNNLYALTLKKDDRAPEIVIKLSEMMRYMLYECNEKQVPLRKEVNYLRNYLDLEQLRQGEEVDITFEVEGEVGDQQIAPLMFIPFLENSFKHGVSHSIQQGFVHARMRVDGDKVHFQLSNSKSDAPPPPSHSRSGGIGLVNIHRRLNLLYPDRYDLRIEDAPNVYTVNLFLELNKPVSA